jgi:PIN domain nuclease of toxin-antitoxin system
MSVLDAYALIAFLADEPPAAEAVEAQLRQVEDSPVISAVNLAEAIDRIMRVTGAPETVVATSVDLLLNERLSVVPADERIGRQAGVIRAQHYHRRRCPVSLADCVAIATSRARNQALATADHALASVARAVGVELVPLPDSRGRLP